MEKGRARGDEKESERWRKGEQEAEKEREREREREGGKQRERHKEENAFKSVPDLFKDICFCLCELNFYRHRMVDLHVYKEKDERRKDRKKEKLLEMNATNVGRSHSYMLLQVLYNVCVS